MEEIEYSNESTMLDRPEANDLEKKERVPRNEIDWRKLAKTVSAMANSGGGDVLLGQTNLSDRIGIKESDKKSMDPTKIMDKIRKYYSPIPELKRTFFTHNGKIYCHITVGSIHDQPCLACVDLQTDEPESSTKAGQIWIRRNASNRPASESEMRTVIERCAVNMREGILETVRKLVATAREIPSEAVEIDIIRQKDKSSTKSSLLSNETLQEIDRTFIKLKEEEGVNGTSFIQVYVRPILTPTALDLSELEKLIEKTRIFGPMGGRYDYPPLSTHAHYNIEKQYFGIIFPFHWSYFNVVGINGDYIHRVSTIFPTQFSPEIKEIDVGNLLYWVAADIIFYSRFFLATGWKGDVVISLSITDSAGLVRTWRDPSEIRLVRTDKCYSRRIEAEKIFLPSKDIVILRSVVIDLAEKVFDYFSIPDINMSHIERPDIERYLDGVVSRWKIESP